VGTFRELDVYGPSVGLADALVQHWLDRAHMRGLALPGEAQDEAQRLGRMLNGLITSRQTR